MNTNINNTVTTAQGTIINLSITSEQDARTMVDTVRNVCISQINADNDAMGKLRIANRNSLYILLGTFCDLSFKLLDPVNKQFLAPVLDDYGLEPAEKGVNPFSPLAKMLFGEWVREITNHTEVTSVGANEEAGKNGVKAKKRKAPPGTTLTKEINGELWFFVPNRSAEKYAKVARYALSQNWKPEEVAQQIAEFNGKMDGVLKADTNATKGTDTNEIEIEKLVKLVSASDPLYTLDISDCGFTPAAVEKRTLVSLWAEVVNGEVLIRGMMPTSEQALQEYVRKYAKANEAKLWKQAAESKSAAE